MIQFFIRRPIFASVCSVIIVLAGAVSIPGLPVAQYPQLAPPQVTVTSVYIGASASTVEAAVTTPLEQQINGVQGMKYLSSTSSSNGVSQIVVTFDIDRNIDIAAVDVQNRVTSAQGALPNEVKATGITVTKNSSSLLLAVGLYAEKGEYSSLFLSNYADVYMRDAIKRVRGVGDVRIFGERRFAMRLWLDPYKLAGRGLSASDVITALREQNVAVAAGSIGSEPAPDKQSYRFTLAATGRLTEPAQFEELVVKTGANGTLVQLKDVGRAELGAEDYNSQLRFDGREAVGLGIFQLPDANALDVARDVRAELARLESQFPPGMHSKVALDATRAVSESISEVLQTLLEAIALVIIVIFVFLQSWRSTVIPAITIPVSLIGTFAFIKAFDFSINTLTLFGITLATGLVVDDAIVVIENIERYIQDKHRAPRQAAEEGMREVFGAVIATSLVLVAVFVPVAFFPGTTGRIYKQFSLTLAFSVAISAFNSVTLTPALSALLLRETHGDKWRVFRWFNLALVQLHRRYARVLQFLFRWRVVTLAVFVAMLGVTYLTFKLVPTGFVPEEDQGYFIITLQAPEGSSLQVTKQVMAEVETELNKIPEIADQFAVAGFSFTGAGSNKGTIFSQLKPWAEREKAESELAGIIGRLRPKLAAIPGAMVLPFAPPSIQGVGAVGGFQFELEDRGSATVEELAQSMGALLGTANQSPALRGVFSSFTANDPQVVLEVDRDKAKALGVPLAEIFSAMQVYLASQYVNDFDFQNRTYRVYVQADKEFRSTPSAIDGLYVRSVRGQMVPLASLVTRKLTTAPATISHFNLFRSAEINGSAAPGKSTGEAIQAMEESARRVLPAGMSYEWAGISREQLESGGQTVWIFVLGLVFVFLVLAAQYESLVLPFVVMMAVPLALFGALGAQALRGLPNDIFCQVGLVMLIGLSSKNAILIVEFASQLREKGRSIADAAIEAAETRLRPILMTSFAFLLGVLPLVIAKGAGSASRHSLGTAVFGGMVLSTTLNLLIIPVLYLVVETLREKVLGVRAAHRGDTGSDALDETTRPHAT